MKFFDEINKSLLFIILGFLVCGFEAGVQIGDPDESAALTDEPVVEYEETVTAVKSDLELYQQYYVIVVSSLEEAVIALNNNYLWSNRMADNAYRYMKLWERFIDSEKKDNFIKLEGKLKPILEKIKTGKITEKEIQTIQHTLNTMVNELKNNYSRENPEQAKE